jgi:hypothetical protein
MPTKRRPKFKPDTPEAFYDQHMSALVSLGTTECGLTRSEARNLAYEVLVASIGNVNRIANMSVWLTAAMRSAARTHRETHAPRR